MVPVPSRGAWAVFLSALSVRVGYALWLDRPAALVGDAFEYHEFARNLVETGRYLGPHGEAASRMPGYPLFLAGLRLFFGGSLHEVIIVQCVVGALTCLLLYQLARLLLPGRWPLVCGLFSAFYFDMIVPSAFLLSECVYSFFLVFSIWALYQPDWRPLHRALAFGALSGCLYLVRPEPLPYILMTILLLPYLWAKGFGRKQVLSALAVFTLITGLWVGRNLVQFSRVIPASSVGQNVKYLSLLLPAEQLGLAPEGRYAAPRALSELEREADMARAYRELAGRLSWPQIFKAYLYNLASILYPFLPAYDWTYVVLLPFFLLGLCEAARRKELRPMAAAVLCSISVFIFFGGPASRYRQGISPFIVLLATGGMAAVETAVGRPRFRAWMGSWVVVNLNVWLFSAQMRESALWVKRGLWRH